MMRVIARETGHAVYPSESLDADWNPSYFTAFGVFQGIKAAVEEVYQRRSLAGIRVAVQGLGKVGYQLAGILQAEGAELVLADIDQRRAADLSEEFGARVVNPDEIYGVQVEVFAPCALGGILNDQVVPRLKCEIVAGAANNQLAAPRHGEALWRRGILYAPDYVINAGGLISGLYETGRWDRTTVIHHIEKIYDRLREIIGIAHRAQIPPSVAADRFVEAKIQRARESQAL